jgi:hypothetical protein
MLLIATVASLLFFATAVPQDMISGSSLAAPWLEIGQQCVISNTLYIDFGVQVI